MKKIICLLMILLLITGCVTNKKNNEENSNMNDISKIKITINNIQYELELEKSSTVSEFISLLPKEYTMSELNGNEKYVYINTSLPTNAINPKTINIGDVMLYGDNCLVIFYKSFNTSYSYTKIGHISNLPDLGNGSVTVKFEQ